MSATTTASPIDIASSIALATLTVTGRTGRFVDLNQTPGGVQMFAAPVASGACYTVRKARTAVSSISL
jgi:hypothetical protein